MQSIFESTEHIHKFLHESRERLKELAAINQTTSILKEGKPVDETLQQIALILPRAWQYPEHTSARIRFGGKEYKSPTFLATEWVQSQHFETITGQEGWIEVFYKKEFRQEDEGPFLAEERDLINNLASLIAGFLNSVTGRQILDKSGKGTRYTKPAPPESASHKTSRQLLQKFLNKNNSDRDIYHDLMAFKVKEILLVANLYDAYSVESEGRFSEHVLGEYQSLNLTSLPRITGVTTVEEAFEQLKTRHFDLIISMMGIDKRTPVELSRRVKKSFPYIPFFVLLNNNSDIAIFRQDPASMESVDKVFVWNGDPKIFFAMIKMVEDKINVLNDTRIGLVRVILLVEDSPKYYSRYMPMLYRTVMEQTQRIIDDVSSDEQYKLLRMRARPKILHVSTYEEALDLFDRFKDYMLCLISDVKFEKGGRKVEDAGYQLVKHIKSIIPDLPTIIQSSDLSNAIRAYELQASFINKNSESLLQDFSSFINHILGFGNFIYRDEEGRQIAVARSLKEFESHIRTIPDESLIYHARRNHFSLWLMARGEIQAAKILNPAKVSDFERLDELREYLVEVIQQFRNEQNKGKIIPFEETTATDETNIHGLVPGSLGGKGRGLAFINTLIYNFDFNQYLPQINIRAPRTYVIGTEEFEYFLQRNNLLENVLAETNYEVIKRWFLAGSLSDRLVKKIRKLLRIITKPIAIRSSGLFEDSLMQPFAGIFETYIVPNNHPDPNERIQQAMDAIKLVFASVFSPTARDYFGAIQYKVEEEKMAVVIQEVVGNQYGDYYYPHISGVAQSYNYYPFAHMQPEDGVANIAVGLGKYVVEGEKTYRFSPLYPTLENYSAKDLYLNSQVRFFAVDLKKKDINLLEGDTAGLSYLDIDLAEDHGNLKHCASVYNPENNTIAPGLDQAGPRIVNFANVLKYNYIPLAKTIEVVLDVVKEALGSPVEIEFAVDLNRDEDFKASFYLLQIKPLIGNLQDYSINLSEIDQSKVLLYTEKGMGNGRIDHIFDVIYIDPSRFDKSQTREMAEEINALNSFMVKEGRQYVLIGPGRWGTRDRWIGVPVTWPQISAAKVIVETSLDNFPLDASSGSHFFHNVTSMNVGYCSVLHELKSSNIAWDVLNGQPAIQETRFFRHVRFDTPLVVRMDGRKRIILITWGETVNPLP